MRSLDIPGVDVQLNMIGAVQGQIELVNEMIRKEFDQREEVRNLTSIPGIGIYSALVIFAEIGGRSKIPRVGAPVLLRRADADRQPVGVIGAIRRHQQGRFQAIALDPDRSCVFAPTVL